MKSRREGRTRLRPGPVQVERRRRHREVPNDALSVDGVAPGPRAHAPATTHLTTKKDGPHNHSDAVLVEGLPRGDCPRGLLRVRVGDVVEGAISMQTAADGVLQGGTQSLPHGRE